MRRGHQKVILAIFLLLFSLLGWGSDDKIIYIAASSTLQGPVKNICQKFKHATGFQCQLVSAPIGHLYAHIMHGMSYDVLISSSETYTQGLINANRAESRDRFILATGRMVLWSSDPNATQKSVENALLTNQYESIALPNPGVSPYGGAAKEILQKYELWHHIQDKLQFVSMPLQGYKLVQNQKATFCFMPLSSLPLAVRKEARFWEPDPKTYKPVSYEVVRLKSDQHEMAARAFLAFLHSKESCEILNEGGFHCTLADQHSAANKI